ncbi:glycosyltransferase family 2 protein [Mariniflexile sp. HNIBRBA6329]|uniref:glycosyltransferase family 2 protein n=1 Tax=Mariniflexile sp. HNIBRBA6329 TaxID=3373088 RepID=UPI003745ACE3
MSKFKATVIISTYNQRDWLEKVLWGYEIQTEANFEIIIADDGSSIETKKLIENFCAKSSLKIKHVWQEDMGFRKTRILNQAILIASTSYLIFTDGDCIPRKDFVETHLKLSIPNTFLSGGYFKLPEAISKSILKKHIINQDCFSLDWLLAQGLLKSFKTNKLTASGFKAWFLNTFTTTKSTFDGMNVSGWKQAILDVNGFDERMAYGGEDRELGERLVNKGLKFKQIRYSAICVHLYHERPYKNEEALLKNKKIRKETKKTRSVYTNFGLKK